MDRPSALRPRPIRQSTSCELEFSVVAEGFSYTRAWNVTDCAFGYLSSFVDAAFSRSDRRSEESCGERMACRLSRLAVCEV